MCYKEGSGVERDTAKAVKWYKRAADHGDADAQFRLGWCFEHGAGVEQAGTKTTRRNESNDERKPRPRALCTILSLRLSMIW